MRVIELTMTLFFVSARRETESVCRIRFEKRKEDSIMGKGKSFLFAGVFS